ncbi:hypothetical protein WS88_00610 [Burkholderia cepacia]|nr:hypothetical protein WS88_00610 [Burkholderia cepacia]
MRRRRPPSPRRPIDDRTGIGLTHVGAPAREVVVFATRMSTDRDESGGVSGKIRRRAAWFFVTCCRVGRVNYSPSATRIPAV